MERRERALLLLLLVAPLCGRLWVAVSDFRNVIAFEILNDEAFYHFEIAETLIRGRGFTFDGVTPTNGFHPLQLLLMVISTLLGGGSRLAPLYITGAMMGLLAVLTGWLLFRLLARRGSVHGGLGALALWAVSPYFIAYSINGLETPMAMAAAVALLHIYLPDFIAVAPAARNRYTYGVPRRRPLDGGDDDDQCNPYRRSVRLPGRSGPGGPA